MLAAGSIEKDLEEGERERERIHNLAKNLVDDIKVKERETDRQKKQTYTHL